MSLSKPSTSGCKKKTLQEKIRFLDFKNANPGIGCRKLVERFDLDIGKTQAATIIKKEKEIRKDFEFFSGKSSQRKRVGKYHLINEALHRWYKKCEASEIYPSGPMCMEAVLIKDELDIDDLKDFSATNGWFEKWKKMYGIRQKTIVGEAGDVPEETIDAWVERIRASGYMERGWRFLPSTSQ